MRALTVCELRTTQCVGPMLAWPIRAALDLQDRLLAEPHTCAAVVTGHSTPAVEDVGGASLRIALALASEHELEAGGWLFGIRRTGARQNGTASSFLPAIACVPGEHTDRGGRSRCGLAELMLMARPARWPSHEPHCAPLVTHVPAAPLRTIFPRGATLEVKPHARVTDFFPGLNAGTWLKIRMAQIADAAVALSAECDRDDANERATVATAADFEAEGEDEDALCARLVAGHGFELRTELVEQPPPDAGWLFQHFGNSGNAGVSGQR